MNMTQGEMGLLLLRFGLAIVYLYFGFSQLVTPDRWVGVVPGWAGVSTLTPHTIVLMNGIFEIVFASLLIFGFWLRPVSFLLAAHLAVITIGMGFNATGVRDFGLTIATLAHGLMEGKEGGNSKF